MPDRGHTPAIKPAASRPPMMRAATSTAAALHVTTTTAPTPLLCRPITSRSSTASAPAALRPALSRTSTTANTQIRPSLLRRATDLLELNPATSHARRHAPRRPSHWTEHAHRSALLRAWDTVHSRSLKPGRPTLSIPAQVSATEQQLLRDFAELGEGEVVLDRDWVEYELGVCLRRPFCNAERMGRFEVLAESAGGRLNWGPW
ncbi:hypothetical protein B0A54_15475 [Friedmanniomyces endolithicus]|uniref:Uncharacterized protein n=1 Tax=Friedmanniomyces endolithicus TaxID=329885 RepID=A0A4U0UB61_9PEZI|nr:hypothetical protein B0A54_15475 [Friedmanniomyces endolithicus]